MTPQGKIVVLAALGSSIIVGGILLFSSRSHDKNQPVDLRRQASRSLSAFSPDIFASASATLQNENGAPVFQRRTSGSAAAIRARFSRLARQGQFAAINAALRLSGLKRHLALSTLAAAWKNDPRPQYREFATVVDAVDWLSRTPAQNRKNRSASSMKLESAIVQPGVSFLAARLANQLLEGNDRTAFLGFAALTLVRVDPAAAYALGDSLSGSAHLAFLGTFLHGWTAQNPEAATQWALTFPDLEMRQQAIQSIAQIYASRAPVQTALWLANLPPGEGRHLALQELGSNWARQDTAAALAWAGNLSDSTERQQATAAIQAVAPIGVGIELARPSKGGYPVATSLVPAGPAAQSGGVQRGDQIVAIANPENQWVGTENIPLEQVISMIRGTPGVPVQLRLLPQGSIDPAQARTITITRRQLLFKR